VHGVIAESWRGSAAEFHAAVPPVDGIARRWSFEVTRPAVVLGSRQTDALLDLDRCRADGVEVVIRRSGGGAVLLEPDAVRWVDLVVPAGHPWWRADVTAAMVVVGRAWLDALADVVAGVGADGTVTTAAGEAASGPLRVHPGPMVHTPWSPWICFDGIGPGEVLAGDAKLVGISQRRTRDWARFQCAVHLRYDPARLERYLAGPLPGPVLAAAHTPVAVVADGDVLDEVVDRLTRALARSADPEPTD
jgi:lipoate-protein ligase A